MLSSHKILTASILLFVLPGISGCDRKPTIEECRSARENSIRIASTRIPGVDLFLDAVDTETGRKSLEKCQNTMSLKQVKCQIQATTQEELVPCQKNL